MSIKKRTIAGVSWSGLGQILSQLSRLVFLVVLAKLLDPEDFGLLGLGMIVVNIMSTFGAMGMEIVLIQRKEITSTYMNTAFWSNLVANCIIGILIGISAPSIASFMHEPRATIVILTLAVIFPIQSLTMVPRAVLRREFKFKVIAYSEIIGEFIFGIVGLIFAVQGLGVWSLIIATVARFLGFMIILFRFSPWQPKWNFDKVAFKDMAGFGLSVMSGGMLVQLIANIDYFIVGRYLGATALGYYTLAFQLAVLPSKRFVVIVNRVLLSTFSKLQDDLSRLRNGFLQILEYLLMAVTPLAIVLVVASPLFIHSFYDEQWSPVIIPMRILAVGGVFLVFNLVGTICVAISRPKWQVALSATQLCLFLTYVFWFGLNNGIAGISWSFTLSVVTSAIFGIGLLMKLVDLRLMLLIKAAVVPVAAGIASGWIGLGIQKSVTDQLPPSIKLAVLLGSISLFYLVTFYVFYRHQIMALRKQLFR